MKGFLIAILSIIMMVCLCACTTTTDVSSQQTSKISLEQSESLTNTSGSLLENTSSSNSKENVTSVSGDSSESSSISVKPTLIGLDLSGYKTQFEQGEDFSYSGLVVKANYSNNTYVTLTSADYIVDSSAYNKNVAGTYTIVVKYQTIQKSYSVTVNAVTITSIALTNPKTNFAFAEDFSVGDLVVKATLSNGQTKTLTSSEYTVNTGSFNCMKVNNYNIVVTAKQANVSSNYSVKVNVADKLKVLMIGNSFADDTIAHSYEVATSLGIAPENILIADLYIGGCTLNTHWTNAQNNLPKYRFGLERNGWFDGGNGDTDFGIEWNEAWTIEQGIKYAKWDFITFQQGSGSSGLADTFTHLQELMDYVKGIATDTVNNPNANPKVKFAWHQTWAYANNSTNTGWNSYGGSGNQLKMYNLINDCVKSQVLPKEEFVAIIPNGTAVQNARTSMIGDNLTRDQSDHLTYSVGRYMTALNMVSILTGRDFSDIQWAPGTEYSGGVSGIYKDICLESVKNSQANPFEITNSIYKEPDISSLYKFDWQPVGGSYWWSTNETNYNLLITSVANAQNFVASAKRFTKEEIPVGSVIKIADGYQIRPDAWDADDTKVESSRPNNYSLKWLEITEEFWAGYTYRAFNISKVGGTSLNGIFDEASKAMEIYVPYKTAEKTNTYYSADKSVLPTIDSYSRYYWMPTNGYYFADGSPNLNVTDVTNGQKYVVPKLFTKQELPVGSVIIVDAGYRYRPVYTSGFDSSATFGRGDLVTCTTAGMILITEEFWGDYTYRSFNVGPNTGTTYQDPYKTAEHFRIYLPKAPMLNFDWQPTDLSYWHSDSASENYNYLITGNTTAAKFVSSKVMFTRDDLPIGSIITIAEGWQYRPEGWNANKDRNGSSGSGITRPVNVTTQIVYVTEEWWGTLLIEPLTCLH